MPTQPGPNCIARVLSFDDGRGPALYAGGGFEQIGGVSVQRVARWDGVSWTGIGWGPQITTTTLTEFDEGSGPALWVGGIYAPFPPATVGLAKYQYACNACYADCDLSGTLTLADFACYQAKFAASEPEADCTHNGVLSVADFACFQHRFVSGCP